MKILTFNIGIKIDNADKVAKFIRKVNPDIVCLQEVAEHVEDSALPMFKAKLTIDTFLRKLYKYSYFGKVWESRGFNIKDKVEVDFGGLIRQGLYVLSKYPIEKAGNIFYYKEYKHIDDWSNWFTDDHARSFQHLFLELEQKKKLQVINVHGVWTADKKGDKRTQNQSIKIIEAATRYKNLSTVILGDFNLLPNTRSIKTLERHYRNLIKEFNVRSTRPDIKKDMDIGNQVVDYIFVNNMVKVKKFEAIMNDISDHLPLLLEFEI